MSMYLTPVPEPVRERATKIVANYLDAFDYRVSGFPGEEGVQMFAVEIYRDGQRVVPKDKRQKPFVTAVNVTHYLFRDGQEDGEPTTVTTRYQG
jgi:hypothetical protein